MKIYIAGQITGYPNYRQQFMLAERRLAELGFSVMNPAWLCAYPAFEREDYIAISHAMLEKCDAVFLLPHWESSQGAKAEKAWAEKRGLAVFDGNKGETGCWCKLNDISWKEKREREERLGKDFMEWLHDRFKETLAEINAPNCKKQRQAELNAALEAYKRVYDELKRREK